MTGQKKPYVFRICAAPGCLLEVGPERKSNAIFCSNLCCRRNASLASNNRRRERYNKDFDYREKIKNRVKNQRRVKDFGISLDEINSLAESQNRRCAICKSHENELRTGLHLDHDHNTGKIRGFLCWPCNTAIGQFKDNVNILQSAIYYLNKNTTTIRSK